MNYIPNTGNAIAQIGQQVGQTISSIPSLVRQDKAYQRAEQALQSEEKIKEAAYTGINSLFRDVGINKTVRAPNKGENKDSYFEYLGQEILPVVSDQSGNVNQDVLSKIQTRLGQVGLGGNEQVTDAIGRQQFIQSAQQDPMYQNIANRQQVSQESPELIGALNQIGGDQVTDPMTSGDINAQIENAYAQSIQNMVARANAGIGKPDELFKELSKNKEMAMKQQIEELKLEQKKIDAMKVQAAQINAGAAQSNQTMYKDGQKTDTFNAYDALQDPGKYSFSTDIPIDPNRVTRPITATGTKPKEGKALYEQRDKIVNDLKSYTTNDGFPMEGTEDLYNATVNNLKTYNAAINIQIQTGVSNDEALRLGNETVRVVNMLESLPIKDYNVEMSPEQIISMFGEQLRADPQVYNRIMSYFNKGKSLKEVLRNLKRITTGQ